jgi:hypothetical protein
LLGKLGLSNVRFALKKREKLKEEDNSNDKGSLEDNLLKASVNNESKLEKSSLLAA